MEREKNFTQGSILRSLLLFAFPVLLALFLQAMYGAVDLLIVGKFATSADVSAVSTGSQIMMTLTYLVSSFAMGTTILLGQQIGQAVLEIVVGVFSKIRQQPLVQLLLIQRRLQVDLQPVTLFGKMPHTGRG